MEKVRVLNLVWKEHSSKTWRITRAYTTKELYDGNGINIGEMFKTRRDALLFLKTNYKERLFIGDRYKTCPPKTFIYRRANHSYGVPTMQFFSWYDNWRYLEGAN